MIEIAAALIGAAASIIAAVIATRRAGPAGEIPLPAYPAGTSLPTHDRISRSLWCGVAGLVLWLLPIAAYLVVLPGLYIGIREQNGPRRLTGPGIALCAVSLVLALINSAIGAYQGAHGVGWWQQ